MSERFTDTEEGTRVVDHEGNHVGSISFVGDNDEYVEMKSAPGITQGIKEMLGWEDDADEGRIAADHVDRVEGDAMYLRGEEREGDQPERE